MYLLSNRLRWTLVSQNIDALDQIIARFTMLSRRSEHFALVAHLRFGQLFLHTFRGEFEAARAVSDRLDASIARPT